MLKNNLQNKLNEIEIIKIDLAEKVLGRISTEIANILRGKNKPYFKPNQLSGSKVIVYNAEKIILTGNKMENKLYHKHSGYIGSLKTINAKDLMKKDPTEIIKKSVMGMLPANRLRKHWMKNLTIYKGNINE